MELGQAQMNGSLPMWPFLIPLMAIGFAFFMGYKRRSHRLCGQSPRVPDTPQPNRTASRFLPGFLTGVLGSLLAMGVIIGFMRTQMHHTIKNVPLPPTEIAPAVDDQAEIVFRQEFERILARLRSDDEGRATPIPVAVQESSETPENQPATEPESASSGATDDPDDAGSLNITLFEPGVKVGRPADELPGWTLRTDESPRLLPRVIQSGQHATVASAEAEALAQLAVQLGEAFAEEHPEAAGWTPPVELVRRIGVVGRRAIQESTVTVGEFTEPVYQAFWEVVPAANLDAQLFAAWRTDALQPRLLLVGGAIGMLTLLFGSLAGYFRAHAALHGKYRNALLWGAAAIAAGSALALVA
jgi:hypothetical protein